MADFRCVDIMDGLTSEPTAISGFKKDNRDFVGHLVAFKIDAEDLEQDMHFLNPASGGTDEVSICGMLTLVQWDREREGVLRLEGLLSYHNQEILGDTLDKKDSNPNCEIEFNFFQYNAEDKSYFPCFTSGDPGTKIQAKVAAGQFRRVGRVPISKNDPAYYPFVLPLIGVTKQDLITARSINSKLPSQFGQQSGA